MIFKVSDLKLQKRMVDYANEDNVAEMTKFLRKKQPDLYNEIQMVSRDPRCYESAKFCLLYCAIALEQVEIIYECKIQKMKFYQFEITKRLIAQNKYNCNKRFVNIISRLERHVINVQNFDDDDKFWITIVLGAFIILLDLQLENKEETIHS